MNRLVGHVDMDCFFAAVEVLDDPDLEGRPIIVGGLSARGVVSTASYEARRFGVHSAMPMFQARRLCPEGVFLPVRGGRYGEVSDQVMALIEGFAPVVEQVSVDEAYFDLTGTERVLGPAETAGRKLKDLIRREVGLTCSVGLGPNKLIAKIASGLRKPDGLTWVPEETAAAFLAPLAVGKIPGVGPRTEERLRLIGVERVEQLRRLRKEELTRLFGVWGERLLEAAWGQDDSPVGGGREMKSVSAEETLSENVTHPRDLLPRLADQAIRVSRRLRARGLKARTVVLKIKHDDFTQITRSKSLKQGFDSSRTALRLALELLEEYAARTPLRPIRLVGLGLANLTEARLEQPELFPLDEAGPGREAVRSKSGRDKAVDQALDEAARRFGRKALRFGSALEEG